MNPNSSPPATNASKCVGIWIRVSTEDQAKGDSPEHHEQRAREYARFNGWHVAEVYDLAGVSGKSVMEHPEAKRMLSDIKCGHITGLIFSKLARLARNTRELLEFSDIFRSQNADMISLQEKIDTSTPAGRLFYTMIAAMAQWEREEIADRVKASVAVRAKLGKPMSGVSPYGYRWKDKKLVLDPAEAPIRRRAYELFLDHRRKGLVARLLNDAGHRTRSGSRWSDIAIDRILHCPSAKGVYQLNRMRQTGSWTWEEKPESEWGTLQIEPIVPEALWVQCNQILEEQHKKGKRPGKKPVQLFGGLAYCGCGQKMYVRSHSPKYVCTKCLNKIPIVDLEGIFYDELKAYFTNTEAVARHLTNARQNLTDKEQLLAAKRTEMASVREEMKQTHQLYLAGKLSADGFGQFYQPLEERLKQLQTSLPTLEAELDYLKVNQLSTDEVLSEASTLYARWPTLPADDKRKIVESILEKVVIGPGDEIELTLSYLPSSEEMTKNQLALLRRSRRVRRP
jgi:site-specific DNA recombinase